MVSLSSLTYMQDMQASNCTASKENETKRLIDIRDGKYYWIAKLKDGNCWMVQNLDLDLNVNTPLTVDNTDITVDWTPTANTQVGAVTTFPSSSDLTFSFDPGEYVYTAPAAQNSCGTSGITSLSQCTEKKWANVAGWSASDSVVGSSDIANDTTKTYDAHYTAGNYYSYTVATTGYTSSSGTAPNSICPKGWQLPPSSGNKSYNTLFTSYGSSNGLLYGAQDIRLAPLYFVYGGYVSSSSLYDAGSVGYYWSSTAYNSSNAYYLYFTTSVYPSNGYLRSSGFSVRCVAR